MKKAYRVKFSEEGKGEYILTLITDDINKSIIEYISRIPVKSYRILEESESEAKSLLLG